jgi:hypothetical protein
MKKGEMIFKRKSNISCKEVPFKSLIWNYICWTLAGKPDKWRIRCQG